MRIACTWKPALPYARWKRRRAAGNPVPHRPPAAPPGKRLSRSNPAEMDAENAGNAPGLLLCIMDEHHHHERAKMSRSFMSPSSAARIASKYFARASPALTRSLAPHVNEGCPSFMTSKSAIKRACLPLPFGNG